MSFASERQQSTVCHALLQLVDRGGLWSLECGPTDQACRLLKDDGGPMSNGEALMLRVAFDVWNGRGGATLGDMLGTFDAGNLRAIAELLMALADGDVNEWLGRQW